MRKNTKFVNWIAKFGRTALAQRVGVSDVTVYYWVIGRNCPRPGKIRKILDLSKNTLTWEDVIAPSEAKRAERS